MTALPVPVVTHVSPPPLTASVVALLRRAPSDGCARLYVVCGEAEAVLEIARREERLLRTGIELRPLTISRAQVQRAGQLGPAIDELVHQPVCTLDDVARTFGLPLVDLLTPLPNRLERVPAGQDLTPRQRQELSRWAGSTSGTILLKRNSGPARERVTAQLRQAGWGDGTAFGVVGTGSVPTLARHLPGICGDARLPLPQRYYVPGSG